MTFVLKFSIWERHGRVGNLHPLREWFQRRGFGIQRGFQQEAYIRALLRDAKCRVNIQTPLCNIPFAVIDLETTGFHPRHGDDILSIGTVYVDDGKMSEEPAFHTYIHRTDPIPPAITELTGITTEHTATGLLLKRALTEWLHYIGSRTLVAYGAAHDTAFIRQALKQCWKTQLHHRIIDARHVIRWLHPDWENDSLDMALKQYSIPIDHRHTADGDARMTAILWEKVIATCHERKVYTLENLYTELSLTR